MERNDQIEAPAPNLDGRAANALTHGLTARRVLDAEREAYAAARRDLIEAYRPENCLEEALVDRLAHLVVRSRRAGELELRAFASCCTDRDEVNWALFERMVQTVGRYDLAVGRALAKAKHELERVLQARAGQGVVPPAIVDFNW